TYDMTGTEWYASVFAFAESPVTADVLWAGSDDGLIHVSRDRGKTWTNVTPPNLPRYTKMSIIDASHFDAGAAYVAANRYQLDDFRPYLFKTTDYGAHWTPLQLNLPRVSVRDLTIHGADLIAATHGRAIWVLDDVTPLRQ